jgi:hypothetical protein
MLYHYTTEAAWDRIQECGYIRAFWPRLRGHPRGVYMTDLGPNTDNSRLVRYKTCRNTLNHFEK